MTREDHFGDREEEEEEEGILSVTAEKKLKLVLHAFFVAQSM